MAWYGLLKPEIGRLRGHHPHFYFVAWQSILSDDEFAEVERRNRAIEGRYPLSMVIEEIKYIEKEVYQSIDLNETIS